MSKFRLWASLAMLAFAGSASAQVGPTYASGHITNVTFTSGSVMIMLDVGLPSNCVGSAYGWMTIPGDYKLMAAFVMGLWLRGDASQTVVTVYADGLVNGYCRLSQIDPAN